jgi:hypothetical protein
MRNRIRSLGTHAQPCIAGAYAAHSALLGVAVQRIRGRFGPGPGSAVGCVGWSFAGPVVGVSGAWSSGPSGGVGWVEPEVAGRGLGDGPGSGVDEPVVVAAQQDQVLQRGGSAVDPVHDVVGVAHDRGAGAAGEPAVPVPGHQGPPDRRGDKPLLTADVEDLPAAAEHDRDEFGLTRHPPHGIDTPGRRVAGQCPLWSVFGRGRRLLRRTGGDELPDQAREAVRVLEVGEVTRAFEQLDAAVR